MTNNTERIAELRALQAEQIQKFDEYHKKIMEGLANSESIDIELSKSENKGNLELHQKFADALADVNQFIGLRDAASYLSGVYGTLAEKLATSEVE